MPIQSALKPPYLSVWATSRPRAPGYPSKVAYYSKAAYYSTSITPFRPSAASQARAATSIFRAAQRGLEGARRSQKTWGGAQEGS